MTTTIRSAAEQLGVSVHTLRFYEQTGVLDSIGRDANGYRRYGPSDIAWIRFLLCLRGTGMSVADVARYAELAQGGVATVEQRRRILEDHERAVEAQMAELTSHLEMIRYKLDHYREIGNRLPPQAQDRAAAMPAS